ncbi:MAG: thioredoxin family protein [Kofleriaceae bacterium]
MFRLVVFTSITLIACSKKEPTPRSGDGSAAVAKTDACKPGEKEGPLTWTSDDYAGALACAKQKKVPLVVDLWAPWCHTCLSMQTTVFMDASFGADADKFIFLKMDTDKEQNAAALQKLSISAWPTFYVLGADEAVLGRWIGAASLAQFHQFLDAGALAQKGGADAATSHLLSGLRAMAVKDQATAATELDAALKAAPADYPRRAEILNSLISTKLKAQDYPGCMQLADQHMDEMGTTSIAADFLVTAVMCADAAKQDAKPLREKAIARWQKLLDSKDLSVDDRSDTMMNIREQLDKLGKKDDAKKIAEQQRALLDQTAAAAPNPLAAMTYNWPRAEVYAYLGRPLDLVPALEKSAKDLPGEYDPRARIGWLYLQAKDAPNAAKWTDEALKLVYGPRKGGLLGRRAEIAELANDKASAIQFRQQQVALYEHLPEGQQQPEALKAAKDALEKLGSTP